MKMRHIGGWVSLFLFVTCFGAVAADKLETKPHLALAMPFVERQGGVGVAFPVMINKQAVILPDKVLRVIYNPPRADDAEVLAIQTRSEKEVAYTKVHKLKSEKPLTEVEMAVIKIARETHWPSVNMYQLALANLNAKNMRVVWVDPTTMELYDHNIELPYGLLVGKKGGRFVDVLAVERGSRGEAAGVKPGDKIREIEGVAMTGDLIYFANTLLEKKKASELSSKGGVTLVLQDEAGTIREVLLKAPTSATFNSGVLDVTLDDLGITEEPVAQKDEEKPPPMPVVDKWRKKVYSIQKEREGQAPVQPAESATE